MNAYSGVACSLHSAFLVKASSYVVVVCVGKDSKTFPKGLAIVVHFGRSVVGVCTEVWQKLRSSNSQEQRWWHCLLSCRRLSSESEVSSPHIKTSQLQSSCHILINASRSQVLQIWSPRRGDSKTSPASAKRCSETLSNRYPGHLVFCHRIPSSEFQMSVSLFSAEKSIFSPQSQGSFAVHPGFITKHQHIPPQISYFSVSEIICLCPLGKGNSPMIFFPPLSDICMQ